MGMYDKFKLDKKLQSEGVKLDLGDFRIGIARAGQGNPKYLAAVDAIQKKHSRAIANNLLSSEKDQEIARELFASTLVRSWEVAVPEDHPGAYPDDDDEGKFWVSGIEGPDGNILPFNEANVILTFKNLPELLSEVKAVADNMSLFRASLVEDQAKN